MNWQPKQPAMRALLQAFLQQTTSVYVVGGAVRDYLLDQQNDKTDLDLVLDQAALPIARQVADRLGWSFYPLDEARDVARLVFTGLNAEPLICDVASLRGGLLETDLLARDFTVNALAFALERNGSTRLIDFCGGQADIAKRQLRRVSSASLADDPVRLLRAVRFVHQLNFTLEEETLIQVKRMSTTVRLASWERVRDELWKILATDTPAQALEDLRAFNLLAHVLPEVTLLIGVPQSPPHYLDVYQHTLQAVTFAAQLRNWVKGKAPIAGRASPVTRYWSLAPAADWQPVLSQWRSPLRQQLAQPISADHQRVDWLVWYALLHDIGKPATHSVEQLAEGTSRHRFLEHEHVGADLVEQRLQALRFSRQEVTLTQAVVEAHMRPHLLHAAFVGQKLSRRACYRFFRDVGGKQFSQLAGLDVLLLALADLQATYQQAPENWSGYLAHLNELLTFALADQGINSARQKPLLDGHQLMNHFNLPPGRQIGELLEQLLEAQVAGDIKTSEEALALASQCLHKNPHV
jgi:poly(A) polymerase/tRNA nucleotidyltransferase (CCA-adding enzyme)